MIAPRGYPPAAYSDRRTASCGNAFNTSRSVVTSLQPRRRASATYEQGSFAALFADGVGFSASQPRSEAQAVDPFP